MLLVEQNARAALKMLIAAYVMDNGVIHPGRERLPSSPATRGWSRRTWGPDAMRDIRATDYHTAGEPFRIVTEGVPDIPGGTVLERRAYAQRSEQVEVVRRLLVNEPRGHADMYGCFLVPPDDEGAHLGVLFWHKDGYSTACGHGTIALGVWAVRTGLVPAAPDGETDVVIDVPSGRVTATVSCAGGAVREVGFRNVPAYVLAEGITVDTGVDR